MNWHWVPGNRCGPFLFGHALPKLTDLPITLLDPSYDGADWQTYRVGDEEARICVENGIIVTVECVHSLHYQGHGELLGLHVDTANAIFEGALTLEERWDDGTSMYEAENLGLTLWVENGHIESATVGEILRADMTSPPPPDKETQS